MDSPVCPFDYKVNLGALAFRILKLAPGTYFSGYSTDAQGLFHLADMTLAYPFKCKSAPGQDLAAEHIVLPPGFIAGQIIFHELEIKDGEEVGQSV